MSALVPTARGPWPAALASVALLAGQQLAAAGAAGKGKKKGPGSEEGWARGYKRWLRCGVTRLELQSQGEISIFQCMGFQHAVSRMAAL